MIYLSYIACKGTIKRAENQENLEFSRVEVLLMSHLASYFDFVAFARDLFIDDYYFTDGYVFRRG